MIVVFPAVTARRQRTAARTVMLLLLSTCIQLRGALRNLLLKTAVASHLENAVPGLQ